MESEANAEDEETGMNALHFCCLNKRPEWIASMLQEGVNPNLALSDTLVTRTGSYMLRAGWTACDVLMSVEASSARDKSLEVLREAGGRRGKTRKWGVLVHWQSDIDLSVFPLKQRRPRAHHLAEWLMEWVSTESGLSPLILAYDVGESIKEGQTTLLAEASSREEAQAFYERLRGFSLVVELEEPQA